MLLVRENFEGQYVYHNRNKLPQACQNGHQTRPQASQNRRRTLPHPPTPELPRQLVSRVGYVEDFDEPRTTLGAVFTSLLGRGCDVRLRDRPTLDPVSANIWF
jgi:hypothetical protein